MSGVADVAKTLGISVEQFFEWSFMRCGHLYPHEERPQQAFVSYKYWGKLPKYVTSQMRSVRLAETFKKIREKYSHPVT